MVEDSITGPRAARRCVSVTACDPRAPAWLAGARGRCAWVELRLDEGPFTAEEIGGLVAQAPAPVIATCRPPREGGRFAGDEGERLRVLVRAAEAGAAWVDVEWDAVARLPEVPARLVVSRHWFEAGGAFEDLLRSTRHPRASVQKVAAVVEDAAEALRWVRRAAEEATPTIALGMGEAGGVMRLLARPWTYVAPEASEGTAPGQWTGEELDRLWVGGPPTEGAPWFGVLGDPVGHSRSPQLMNAAFARLGVEGVYAWLRTRDPLGVIEAGGPCVRGVSVTLPHKQVVAAAALAGRWAAPEVAATGAANTLARVGEGWVARNTDALAARALVEGAGGARACVVGSGGVARAVAWALREEGAEVVVRARDRGKAEGLVEALGLAGVEDWGERWEGGRWVAQCTSVGMQGEESVVPGEGLEGGVAYELVYTPEETGFVQEGRRVGARVITGVEHFALQARGQLEAWWGAGARGLELEWLGGFARGAG